MSETPAWMTPEFMDEHKRIFDARVAWHLRNNRYGNMTPYLARGLEILRDVDPQVSSSRMIDGEAIETLLDELAPIGEGDLARLRAEVRDLYERLAAATDPGETTIAAVHLYGSTLSVLEQCLLPD